VPHRTELASRPIPRVSSEAFVSAVTSERHRDVLPRLPRQNPERQDSRVGKWFAELWQNLRQILEKLRARMKIPVRRAQVTRDGGRRFCLVVSFGIEANGKSL
jgi:hypothetical protein